MNQVHEHLLEVAQSLARHLNRGQPLFVTVRLGEGAKWDRYDDPTGEAERFIQLFSADALTSTLEAASFRIHLQEVEESYWGRPSPWLSLIALKG